MNTNRWMQEVNARFPVRKSKVQKAQFRQYVLQKAQEMGYAARMEENKAICTNRNIVCLLYTSTLPTIPPRCRSRWSPYQ